MNGGYIGVILLDPKGGRFGIYRSRLRGDVGWYCFDGLAWHVGAVAGAWRTILWGGKLDLWTENLLTFGDEGRV